jgi:hypothetical protein
VFGNLVLRLENSVTLLVLVQFTWAPSSCIPSVTASNFVAIITYRKRKGHSLLFPQQRKIKFQDASTRKWWGNGIAKRLYYIGHTVVNMYLLNSVT